MRILFLLLVTLFISPTFAQVGNICLLEDDFHTHVLMDDFEIKKLPKECKVGDILSVHFWNHGIEASRVASQYCDFEKQIIFPSLKNPGRLVCVIKTKTPRNETIIK